MYSILELYANKFADLMNASIRPDDVCTDVLFIAFH